MNSETGLSQRFRQIQLDIEAACRESGRNRSTVTIVGASKSQPVERLAWAWNSGLRVFGENRVQEAVTKAPQLDDGIDWHLIGPLQSNKAKKAVELFSTVHSIDRPKIARVLDREAERIGRHLQGFIEVNLADESTKHGFSPTTLLDEIDGLADLGSLEIVGLMAIPPFESNPARSRDWFAKLRELRDQMVSTPPWTDCPGLLSMGMSLDYGLAVEEGATHVRVGTALFGPRGS